MHDNEKTSDSKMKYLLYASIFFNFVFTVVFFIFTTQLKQITLIVSSNQNELNDNQNMDKKRTNGTLILETEKDKSFDDLVSKNDLVEINKGKFATLGFTRTLFDYKTEFEKYSATDKSGVVVTIEKIKDEPPYLVQFTPSEWLGVRSIEGLAALVTSNYADPEVYNEKINGINFSKQYVGYPGSFKQQYATVFKDNRSEYLYYLTISSDWEIAPEDKSVDPAVWYKTHPSEKFKALESFIEDIVVPK